MNDMVVLWDVHRSNFCKRVYTYNYVKLSAFDMHAIQYNEQKQLTVLIIAYLPACLHVRMVDINRARSRIPQHNPTMAFSLALRGPFLSFADF